MGERFSTRALVVTRALSRRAIGGKHRSTHALGRVLIAHNLLLGDTLMLTPLLAKLRATDPDAQITLLAAPAFVPIYRGRPYGVRALPFAPSKVATARALMKEGPFDLALVVGDNRYSWLAAAMGAQWIVAHAGDHPWSKDWFVDEKRAYPAQATPWGEVVADLVDGSYPPPYAKSQWPAPPAAQFERPAAPYAVLHVGASTALKHWPAQRWMALALELRERGIHIVWSAGRGEEEIVRTCDPHGRFPSYAAKLDLAQLWHLIEAAVILVVPDTGIAHLGRVTGTPTVALFGPGSALICGAGRFWHDMPWRAVMVDPFSCRNQKTLFNREIDWVRHCARSVSQCPEPRCMHAIGLEAVLSAAQSFAS